MGVCGTCIGCAGWHALVDIRGRSDRRGRTLRVTQLAVADQLCASAALVSGDADESRPLVIVRGVPRAYFGDDQRRATTLVRPLSPDLFRLTSAPPTFISLAFSSAGSLVVLRVVPYFFFSFFFSCSPFFLQKKKA